MKFNLNRTFKKFPIEENTPLDLIVFLMKTTGKTIEREKIEKKFEKIKNYLETYQEYIEISENYDHKELNKITTYISDLEEPWSVRNLLDSFKQLVSFHTNFSFDFIHDYARKFEEKKLISMLPCDKRRAGKAELQIADPLP